jgi:phospholipid/cholesterol/gamma-HCH transport system substrate-binding protein
MSDRKKAAKVGIFTFVVGVLLALVLFVFGGVRLFKHQTRYFVELKNSVMGLSEGVGVYFNGIHVGSVHSIALDEQDPSLVRVAIDVEQGTPVRSDTKAIISSTGLTGLKVVDLQGGSPTATALPAESIIPAGAGGFDKLQKQAEELADQTGKMMKRATDILDHADQIVSDLQHVTDPQALGAIVESTKGTAANLNKASAAIDAMIAENRVALKASIGSVSKATDNASQVATDLRTLIRTNQGTISSTLADLRQGARMFKDLAREVREKPSRLLLSSSPDERKLP